MEKPGDLNPEGLPGAQSAQKFFFLCLKLHSRQTTFPQATHLAAAGRSVCSQRIMNHLVSFRF